MQGAGDRRGDCAVQCAAGAGADPARSLGEQRHPVKEFIHISGFAVLRAGDLDKFLLMYIFLYIKEEALPWRM